METNRGEIVVYQPDEIIRLEVRVEDENVWLNRRQLSLLFGRDVKTIGKHINNALQEELKGFPVVAIFATTASDLIKSARRRVILIDNYVDESVLMMLAKRDLNVLAEVRTGRFLIVDDAVYHLGASLKDLGKKLFAFSKLSFSPNELL